MYKRLTVLITFFIGFSTNKLHAKEFKKYLYYTNKAEMSIIHGDYHQAQMLYDSSFYYWNKPFATDLYNAMRCACYDSDYVQTTAIARKLVALGCTLSFFEKSMLLRAYCGTAHYSKLTRDYPAIREKYIKNNNWKLRTEIEILQSKDQFLRRLNPDYTFLKDSIYKVDDTVKLALMNLFKHKFPNEYDYGVFLNGDTALTAFEPLHVVILHNYGLSDTANDAEANRHTVNFTSILRNAIEKGDMQPQEFAYLNDRSGMYKIGKGSGEQMILIELDSNKLYFNNISLSYEKKYDSCRRLLYLDTYAEEKEKALFTATNKNGIRLFRSMGPVSVLSDLPLTEQMKNKMFIYTGKKMD